MPNLAEVQDAFTAALLDRTARVPRFISGALRSKSNRRFAVYRNNVAAGLVSALASRFPVTRRLVGDEFFDAMARLYAMQHLPRSPVMLLYGETFPAFIAGFAPAAPIPYLADVARIEMARGLAYHAADATPLEPGAFAALPKDRLGAVRMRLHPSVAVITSNHPIHSIWHVNQDPERFVPVAPFAREGVLIARPYLQVNTQRITHAVAGFVRKLAAGKTLADATDLRTARECLEVLIGARIVVGFET